ncbi:MAG: PfkB family carbohydrate kinase [Candidatus Dormibacteria bacterium]
MGIAARPRRLLVTAQVLIDELVYLEHMPHPGESTMATGCIRRTGGAFNVAAAAARLGMPTCLVGKVGTGPNGDTVLTDLKREGVTLLLPRTAAGDTGFDIGLVESSGVSSYIGLPGVEATLEAADLRAITPQVGDAVYVSGYDLAGGQRTPSVLSVWLSRMAADVGCVFDPGPPVGEIEPRILSEVLSRSDLVTLNMMEGHILSGRESPDEVLQAVAVRLHAGGCVVLRDGARGAWVGQRGGPGVHVPARLVERVVDTTGAGDAHTGALVAWLGRGSDVLEAAAVGNVAASLSIERVGPATGPSLGELLEALEERGIPAGGR